MLIFVPTQYVCDVRQHAAIISDVPDIVLRRAVFVADGDGRACTAHYTGVYANDVAALVADCNAYIDLLRSGQ